MSNSFAVSWTVAHQAPLSMGFSRPEYWSGLPSPPPEELPEPGIEPDSPALAGGFFTTEPLGKLYVELDPVGKKEQVQQTECQTVRARNPGLVQVLPECPCPTPQPATWTGELSTSTCILSSPKHRNTGRSGSLFHGISNC